MSNNAVIWVVNKILYSDLQGHWIFLKSSPFQDRDLSIPAKQEENEELRRLYLLAQEVPMTWPPKE